MLHRCTTPSSPRICICSVPQNWHVTSTAPTGTHHLFDRTPCWLVLQSQMISPVDLGLLLFLQRWIQCPPHPHTPTDPRNFSHRGRRETQAPSFEILDLPLFLPSGYWIEWLWMSKYKETTSKGGTVQLDFVFLRSNPVSTCTVCSSANKQQETGW
jgi:hypothetical protein